ncbi:MAG: hypothetical protein ACRC0G_08775 [Fusobacteriaceae bacterium]
MNYIQKLGINILKDEKVDLYLSGHTHKGQLFPFNLIVNYMYKNSGGYKTINNVETFVSFGLGTWMIPYRIDSQSEILIFFFNILVNYYNLIFL